MTRFDTQNISSGIIALPEFSHIPSMMEIQRMLDKAFEVRCCVTQAWKCGTPEQSYALHATMSKDPFDSMPRWAFTMGAGEQAHIEWVYATPDVSLIHNMLLCTFADAQLTPETHASYAYIPSQSALPSTSLPTHSPTKPAPSSSPSPVLHGFLQSMPPPDLVQSLSSSRLTGRLNLTLHDVSGYIYFEDGVPVDAQFQELDGNDAMLELLTWHVGEFAVFGDERSNRKSVTRRMNALLMESATMSDHEGLLAQMGIDSRTALFRTDATGWGEQKQAIQVDLNVQQGFLNQVDGRQNVAQIARECKLTKAQWLPILVNLVRAGAVSRQTRVVSDKLVEQTVVDTFQKETARQGLVSPTGLYSSPAFILFLEMEFGRYHVHRRPFSLILMRVKKDPTNPTPAADVIHRIYNVKDSLRECDLLCHFETSGFGIILPETDEAAANSIVRKILNDVTRNSIGRQPLRGQLWMKIGCATVPNHCDSLGFLISEASRPERSSVFVVT